MEECALCHAAYRAIACMILSRVDPRWFWQLRKYRWVHKADGDHKVYDADVHRGRSSRSNIQVQSCDLDVSSRLGSVCRLMTMSLTCIMRYMIA